MALDILLEDNHCLAVNKAAGRLVQGDVTGDASLYDLVRDYLKVKYQKPGEVYLGLVHRLDRPTSGVVLLARTSKAAARLSEQFRAGTVEKFYLALVEGAGLPDQGEWRDHLTKDEARNVVHVVAEGTKGGQEALVAYRVLDRRGERTLVELRPRTGRSHQLRVQLASRGFPIVGDLKYGAKGPIHTLKGQPRIALHAQVLNFTHPTRRESIELSAPLPADWPEPGLGPKP